MHAAQLRGKLILWNYACGSVIACEAVNVDHLHNNAMYEVAKIASIHSAPSEAEAASKLWGIQRLTAHLLLPGVCWVVFNGDILSLNLEDWH